MSFRAGMTVAFLVVLSILLASAASRGASGAAAYGGPSVGLNCGRDLPRAPDVCRAAGAGLARIEFSVESTPDEMQQMIAAYAARRIKVQPLAGFHSSMPTLEVARGLRRWALRFGPRGTFWNHRSDRRLAITYIEFGNETSYGWQYGDRPTSDSYVARARAYAFLARAAALALRGTGVSLLVQGDDGGFADSTWFDQMFDAVPDLVQYASGWTIHPYGPNSTARIDRMLAELASRNPTRPPRVFVTEWGLASDDGRPLDDNYGYPTRMTYDEAAGTLRSVLGNWSSRYGRALVQAIIFQSADREPPGASENRESFFGVLKFDGSDKGSYTAEVHMQLSRTRSSLSPRSP